MPIISYELKRKIANCKFNLRVTCHDKVQPNKSFVKELRNHKPKITFCVSHEYGLSCNQHSKLLFFTKKVYTLGHQRALNSIFTQRKLNLLFISSTYLAFSPLRMHGTLIQTKIKP